MNAIRSVDYCSAVERAYAFIKGGILTLKFRQRDRLATQELAEQLKISRTPIREALARLEQEGLVVRDAGWGYVVREYSASEVLNLYRVREALEVEAMCEAIQRIDRHLVSLLGSIMDKAETHVRASQFNDFQSLNRQFYTLIAQATGNELLQQMLRTISDRIRILGALTMEQNSARAEQILFENKAVLEAIRLQDVSRAEFAVREHIRRARDHVILSIGTESS